MALTRARPVCGDESLQVELEEAIRTALSAKRDAEATREDVLAMRKLMLKEQGQGGVWDIKRTRGGLVEVEFIAQTLQLIHAHPEVLDTNTLKALAKLTNAGHLSGADSEVLRGACQLYSRLTQVLRLCVTGAYDPGTSPEGLNRIVASAALLPGIASAEALLAETEAKVAQLFDRLIGAPQ